jgi:hypothetical protein
VSIFLRAAITALAAAALCSCATLREAEIRQTEEMLAAAGFTMKPADTPDKIFDLANLPPYKPIAQRRNGDIYYVYADPGVCRCVWVGDQQQYSQFQRLRLQKRIADEQLMAAQSSENAMLHWDLWRPWPWF